MTRPKSKVVTEVPAPCKPDIFKNGHSIVVLDGCSYRVEQWVKAVAKESGQPVDWHYTGGRANVLYLGDYDKIQAAIKTLTPELAKTPPVKDHSCRCAGPDHDAMSILASYGPNTHGPYRAGDLDGD